jgi:predicted nucleic acid-binding Zn ribbon protein
LKQKKKKCLVCSEEFSPSHCLERCCSQNCRIERNKNLRTAGNKRYYEKLKAKKEPQPPNTCIICDKEYKKTNNRKTCSDKCSIINTKNLRGKAQKKFATLEYYREYQRKWRNGEIANKEIICVICKFEGMSKIKSKKTCSKECSKLLVAINMRRSAKMHWERKKNQIHQ